MKHFLLIANRYKDPDLAITGQVRSLILEKGAVCDVYDHYDPEKDDPVQVPELTDCILIIGGDGTILDTIRRLSDKTIPLLGVNIGTLGFLADIKLSDLGMTIERLIDDEYQLEKRMMIKAEILHKGESIRSFTALNDFNINRVGTHGPICLQVKINGSVIDSYRGDGIIICTPTGSTGYNLSAGGPIINPTCKNFVLTPICCHSLTARPIVLSGKDVVSIRVEPVHDQNARAVMSFDGKRGYLLEQEDQIIITKSENYAPFVKMQEVSFVEILKEKLL